MSKRRIREELHELRQRIEVLEREDESSVESEGDSHCCSGCKRPKGHETGDQGQVLERQVLVAEAGRLLRVRSSIDASRNDNGFLGCVYTHYRQAINNTVYSHWTTAAAFSNLRAGSADVSIIVGHGTQGLIVTGTGQVVDGTDRYMAAGNESSWRPYASPGIPGYRLVLFGCEVGGGTAGANFLSRVANAVRKEVGAWTGLVWCNADRVWGTGNFVTASPGRRLPEAVDSPVMYEMSRDMVTLRIQSAQGYGDVAPGYEDVVPGAIRSVNFTPIGSVPQEQELRAINLRGPDAGSLLQAIDFANPFVTEDKPASVLVGLLTITYESTSKEEHTRSFRVLGYSLIQDTCFPTTYYYASHALRSALQLKK